MIEVIITKSQGGRDQVDTFGNRYLYSGNDNIESNDVRDLITNLMVAEQAFYPTDTNFVRGVVREVDAKGVPVRGRTRSIPLEGQGEFVIPVGDKLAPSHIVATVERQAVIGRPGYGYYRHCVTVDEYQAWLQDRTVPARFSAANVTLYGNASTVWLAMLNAVGVGQLTAVLPDAYGDLLDAPRTIDSIQFGGFRLNSPTRPKKSKRVQLAEGFQGEINSLARTARQAWKEWNNGVLTPNDIAIVVDLATQAALVYYTAPLLLRGALKWPRIFATLPPVAPGGNLPQLPFGGN